MNKEKIAIIIFKGKKSEKNEDKIKFKTNETEEMKLVAQHIVLGWTINKRLSMDTHLSKTILAANLKMHQMMKMRKYMNLRTKIIILKAHVLSIFCYGIEQYIGESTSVKASLMEIFIKTR